MASKYPMKNIRPSIPSMYIDKSLCIIWELFCNRKRATGGNGMGAQDDSSSQVSRVFRDTLRVELDARGTELGVAMPQWVDQTTNAKFVEDVWRVGVRVRVNEKGIVTKEEIEVCIREVME
ncbi:hypothetical protein Patl1_26888 [Pistacia atlantica]|uniref:Uncharacterized protein n=1 Tax=Pistacia atlantica TaxID=434234 RepID=A0ACC1AZX7_9ROSI|nr:hypothetical protein Patl1_26888 [Pistacia atlantica]